MPQPALDWFDLLEVGCFILAGAAAVTVIIARGWLHPRSLDQAPPRTTRLGLVDLLIGLLLLLTGQAAAHWLLAGLGWLNGTAPAGPGPTSPARIDSLHQAWASLIAQLLSLGPAVVFLLLRVAGEKGDLTALGLARRDLPRQVMRGLIALILSLPLVMGSIALAVLVGWLFSQEAPRIGHVMLQAIQQSQSPLATLLMLLSALIVAPLFEELVFRGLVQTSLLESQTLARRRWWIVLLAAVFFALTHLGMVPWQALIGLIVLGVILGWLYEWTGSLWPPLTVHVGFNALNVLLLKWLSS